MASSCQNGRHQNNKFVEEESDDFTCLICQCVATDPQQLTCDCGRIYCKVCVDQHFAYFNSCPQCRQPAQAFPDARSVYILILVYSPVIANTV